MSDLLLRLLLPVAGGMRQLHPHVFDWNTQDLALLFAGGYLRADDTKKEEKRERGVIVVAMNVMIERWNIVHMFHKV